MSERRSRRDRRVPSYVAELTRVGLSLTPGSGGIVAIAHDGDCAYWDNLPCDCNPDVRLSRYEPPMPVN